MINAYVVLHNPTGIMVENAGVLIQIANRYQSTIQLEIENTTANAKSLLSVLGAGIKAETEINVICDGTDEELAVHAICQAISEGLITIDGK